MLKAPFVENFQDLEITTHNISFTNDEWNIEPFENIRKTLSTTIWVNHSEYTDIINCRGLTTSLTLILRNQSDLSNVIICVGTFTSKPTTIERTTNQELEMLTQYQFSKSETYKTEQKIIGKNGLKFEMPQFNYADTHFDKVIV